MSNPKNTDLPDHSGPSGTPEPMDRRAVARQTLRTEAKAAQRRRVGIVGACVVLAAAIVGAAAYPALKDHAAQQKYADLPLAQIGAPASVCGDVTTAKATGNQQHVAVGTPMSYPEAPPAFGPHWEQWDGFERKMYTAQDRPDVGMLVHNLEHGYTIVWYDEDVAGNDTQMAQLRAIASKFKGSTDLRAKLKIVPWTRKDGDAFPDGQHVAFTHWSVAGKATDKQLAADPTANQQGVWQYCTAPSGAALDDYMTTYPYMDSPEPTVM